MKLPTLTITEAGFTRAVIELAGLCGWRVQHARPALRADGSWRTAICGHAGFPDLCLARKGRVIFAELKTRKGKTSEVQDAWLAVLRTGPCEVYVWKPESWDEIQTVLA